MQAEFFAVFKEVIPWETPTFKFIIIGLTDFKVFKVKTTQAYLLQFLHYPYKF